MKVRFSNLSIHTLFYPFFSDMYVKVCNVSEFKEFSLHWGSQNEWGSQTLSLSYHPNSLPQLPPTVG